jgi:hypothetical protein
MKLNIIQNSIMTGGKSIVSRRITKNVKVLIICVFSMIFMSTTVSASTESSPYETPTINGYKYSFTSEVWERGSTTGTTVEAVAFIKANTGVPTGYMGGAARLYDQYGIKVYKFYDI